MVQKKRKLNSTKVNTPPIVTSIVPPIVPLPRSAESSTVCVQTYQRRRKPNERPNGMCHEKVTNPPAVDVDETIARLLHTVNAEVDAPSSSSTQSSSEGSGSLVNESEDINYLGNESEGIDDSVTRGASESEEELNKDFPNEIDKNDDGGWRLVRAIEGGPTDISLLTSYRGHVAYEIWNNKDRGILHCQTRVKALSSWKMEDNEGWAAIVREKGLAHLSDCMFNHLNTPLISAFVERWHPETNSFHMPFGEMSITLHDVAYLLNLKIGGSAVFDARMAKRSVEEGKSIMDLMKESLSRNGQM